MGALWTAIGAWLKSLLSRPAGNANTAAGPVTSEPTKTTTHGPTSAVVQVLPDPDILVKRPSDRMIGSDYGKPGRQWKWHLDNGVWKPGQKKGYGNHRGYDFLTPVGNAVFACADGEVLKAGWEDDADHSVGFGLRVVQRIKFGGATYLAFYGHLSKIYVVAGDKPTPTDMIGLSGNTGRSSGPHLHFEVRTLDQVSQPVKWAT